MDATDEMTSHQQTQIWLDKRVKLSRTTVPNYVERCPRNCD